jgi:hypothetical protein
VFDPTTAGIGLITATSGGFSDSTGTVTVTHGVLNRFVVVAPASATAGLAFTLRPSRQSTRTATWSSYTGSQTLVFSGPANAPNATPPSYPATVNFVSGVATTVPVTLVKAETVKVGVAQAGKTGLSGNIVVLAAAATHLIVVRRSMRNGSLIYSSFRLMRSRM